MKTKAKRKFHWWYLPLGVLLVLLAAVAALVLWMHASLPWPNMLAMTSNFHLELSAQQREAVAAGERDYSTLPDPLIMTDGAAVTTTQEFERRRAEILQLFEENVYGSLPKTGFETGFSVLNEQTVLDGRAVRRQVQLTVTTGKGSSDALLLLYLPAGQTDVPVVLGLNFNGNHTVLADDGILPSYAYEDGGKMEEERGAGAARWAIEEAVARGYGIATIYCNDFAPDSGKTYDSRVIGLFDEPEFKTIGAWAFGLMRGVDYLSQAPGVDGGRIALIGHSRLGKAALWAAANDERVALVFSNDSGNSGASLSRGNKGETVQSINAFFPHWFTSRYKQYGGNENALPVDQNLLLACIAPRKVYVACAESDLWADPQGAWNSLMASRNAFALYGLEVLDDAPGLSQPAAGSALFCESMGYHVRAGWHDVQAEDWENYFAYMDRYLQ